MKLKSAQVRNYRSIKDTGLIEFESDKTILVGPNEAGKTAILQALQQVKPPAGARKLEDLRDYPRSLYNDITTKKVDPDWVDVVRATFELEKDELADLPESLKDATSFIVTRYMDNQYIAEFDVEFVHPRWTDISKDLARIAAHVDGRVEGAGFAGKLDALQAGVQTPNNLAAEDAAKIHDWLKKAFPHIEEGSDFEVKHDNIVKRLGSIEEYRDAVKNTYDRVPVFVLSSNYSRVRPRIHLNHLARRQAEKLLEDENYDYGNLCLLKLLGFTASELSRLGNVTEEQRNDPSQSAAIQKRLDTRQYQLDAASARLTKEISEIWNPDKSKGEADRLKLIVDGQYLKLVVEDDIGVSVELDQRSEGFQWLVSFFIVFFAEAEDRYENAILLLDEPGMSLHALKQREFQKTISKLSKKNQTVFTTHSPFLVGSNELDMVRVVEMKDRETGTKVHKTVASHDPAALLPLQEALGYDLAQSLFAKERNLILEGLTDYWYVDAVSELFTADGLKGLMPKIALVPAGDAGKVVYFATILHAHSLKVAALLDSDAAGDSAAKQDVLVSALKQRGILRTKDFLSSQVAKPEIEDLLRTTLISVAKSELGWDVETAASRQGARPIVDIFEAEFKGDFSKYKLAKAFLRWSRTNNATALTSDERGAFERLFAAANKALA